jgi:hypothetical protein
MTTEMNRLSASEVRRTPPRKRSSTSQRTHIPTCQNQSPINVSSCVSWAGQLIGNRQRQRMDPALSALLRIPLPSVIRRSGTRLSQRARAIPADLSVQDQVTQNKPADAPSEPRTCPYQSRPPPCLIAADQNRSIHRSAHAT